VSTVDDAMQDPGPAARLRAIEEEARAGRRWTIEELLAMTSRERVTAQEAMMHRAIEEEDRRDGPLRPGDLGLEKGRLPTITRLVSTPEERSRPGGGTGAQAVGRAVRPRSSEPGR
jgi:hypothetical protein